MIERFQYDNKIVKAFLMATIVFGIVGMLVGLPLHTNAIIFAFVGNGMFAGIYYSLQRLLKARMFSDGLSWLHFWGWQLIIVAAAITLPLGI
nr:cbb3-type cytochrome c oxidase subunit I [Flavobacteriales bacterium]